MHYKNPNAIPVVALIDGIEFKATITEEQANSMFGPLSDFDSKEVFYSYFEDGEVACNVDFDLQAPEVEEDEEDKD